MTTFHSEDVLDPATRKNVDAWLHGDYDESTKTEIRKLLQTNPKEIEDAFYTQLAFGTGGLRGIMGVGSNRLNIYTVAIATQGLANYLRKQFPGQQSLSVIVGYDCRLNSKSFAETAAKVLAGNEIRALLFSELRPTPLISFGCRFKGCNAGIMITASHNPPEYNGYKVYWADGGQIVHPHDEGIMAEIQTIHTPVQVKSAETLQNPLITSILEEVDQAYVKTIHGLQNYPKENKELGHHLKYVYTSLHGTGITMMPPVLKSWGFANPLYVESQIVPDGHFPTVNYPNPEDLSSLKMGLELLEKKNADLLIATDPDADRLGVAIRHKGETVVLNGNEVGCICLDHICKALTSQKKLPLNAAFIKTIVTSELFKAIAQTYQRKCYDELIGFKYIAHRIHEWEENPKGSKFIFAAEESLGYLLGTAVRDKDGISAAALVCEAALHAKLKGKTLVDNLHELYEKYGVYAEELGTIKFKESKEGHSQMSQGMAKLRQNYPHTILDIPVSAIDDYQTRLRTDVRTKATTPLTLPKSNVISFWLEDGSKISVRPSGTEPKIKLYGGATIRDFQNLYEAITLCRQKVHALLEAMEALIL